MDSDPAPAEAPGGSSPSRAIERTSVLVADEYPVVRRGIAAAVRRRWDLELAGEAGDGHEAHALIRELTPQVALVQAALPGISGAELSSLLTAEHAATRVLIFSDRASGADIRRAFAAGAAGYLTKREPISGVCDAIRRAGSGDRFLSREAEAALLDYLRSGEPLSVPTLTSRELEVLRLMAQGASSAEVGKRLHLSKSTVKNHQRHLYDKLGASTAAEAVYNAMRQEILR